MKKGTQSAAADEQLRARSALGAETDDMLRLLIDCLVGEALDLCRQHRSGIGLVLTDVVMPEMGGDALIEKLRQVFIESRRIQLQIGLRFVGQVENLRRVGNPPASAFYGASGAGYQPARRIPSCPTTCSSVTVLCEPQ